MGVTINLINAQRKVKVDDAIKASFKKSAEAVLNHEGIEFPCEIDVKLVSDKGIRELNRDFREVDAPTDVLSFPSGELDEYDEEDGFPCFLGDIALSLEFAKRQCEERDGAEASLLREVTLLTTHSVLHLLGYDHAEEDEKEEMFAIQEKLTDEIMSGK
ncbi:MAG: rRNA maturation RNase YbeY [Clostridia bacterium]|nr:rRNA maturation RNase YbeY [Clostridia bacterium]